MDRPRLPRCPFLTANAETNRDAPNPHVTTPHRATWRRRANPDAGICPGGPIAPRSAVLLIFFWFLLMVKFFVAVLLAEPPAGRSSWRVCMLIECLGTECVVGVSERVKICRIYLEAGMRSACGAESWVHAWHLSVRPLAMQMPWRKQLRPDGMVDGVARFITFMLARN